MHILFLPSWYCEPANPINGVFFREQAHVLKKEGYEVGVIALYTSSPCGPALQFEYDEGIHTYRCYLKPNRFGLPPGSQMCRAAATLKVYRNYVARFGAPDIIHLQSMHNTGFPAAVIKDMFGVPFVITEHYSGLAQGRSSPWHLALLKWVVRRSSGVAVVSPFLGEALERRLGHALGSWTWIPNMVDPMFQPGAPERNDRFRFLSVAMFTELKGHRNLLRAFAAGFKGDVSVELRLVGDGHLRSELESLARDLEIAHQVQFLGVLSRPDVLFEMQRCDLFVHASHFETFGVVLIEAMACGKPCIATSCGGPNYLINDSNGVLVPPDDEAKLTLAMLEMRESSARYDAQRISEECRALFGPKRLLSEVENLYAKALSDRSLPRKQKK